MTGAARIVDGKYRVGPLVGRGAMGAVYAAQHVLTQVEVALKLVPPNVALTPQGQERFKREVAIAALVGHPGIVRVLDAGVDPADQTHYVVMERLAGEDLAARALADDFTVADGVTAIRAALDPLAAAHAHGVVHRDLKPENLFLHAPAGQPTSVKILDFGIARDRTFTNTVTAEDVALGTPNFMSPEQAMNARSVTPASDVWSVGVMLYWLLAGHLPFERANAFETLRAVCSEEAPPIAMAGGPATSALVRLVMRCLDKDPTRRPANAAALAVALDDALGCFEAATSQESAGYRGPSDTLEVTRAAAAPMITPTPTPRPPAPRRSRAPFALVAVLLVFAVSGFAAWWTWGRAGTEVQSLPIAARYPVEPVPPASTQPVVEADAPPADAAPEEAVALIAPAKKKVRERRVRRREERRQTPEEIEVAVEPDSVVADPIVEAVAPAANPIDTGAPAGAERDAGEKKRDADEAKRDAAERVAREIPPPLSEVRPAAVPRDAGAPRPIAPPPPPPVVDDNPFVTF